MGKKPKKDESYFNYPIPTVVYDRIRKMNKETNIPVKDIVLAAIVSYLNMYEGGKNESE